MLLMYQMSKDNFQALPAAMIGYALLSVSIICCGGCIYLYFTYPQQLLLEMKEMLGLVLDLLRGGAQGGTQPEGVTCKQEDEKFIVSTSCGYMC